MNQRLNRWKLALAIALLDWIHTGSITAQLRIGKATRLAEEAKWVLR